MNITFNVTPPKGVYNALEKKVSGEKEKKSGFGRFVLVLTAIAAVAVFAVRAAERIRETELKLLMNSNTVKANADKETEIDNCKCQPHICRNSSESVLETEKSDAETGNTFRFTVNTSARKYHLKECGAVKKLTSEKKNTVQVKADSLEDAQRKIEQQGYVLCGLCKR